MQITENERTILAHLPSRYKWIARSGNGDLMLFMAEPRRDLIRVEWLGIGGMNYSMYNHLFCWIKYNTAYCIQSILDGDYDE